MNIIDELNNKQYKLPCNIPQKTLYKYMEVIENDWVRYLDLISRCGPFCMQQQFVKLIEILNPNKNYTKRTSKEYGRRIIKRLEELKFIKSDRLNNNKFIYLLFPSYVVIDGNYNNKHRVNFKKDFNNVTFMNSILKVEYFIEHGDILQYSNMHNQLYYITKKIYELIIKTDNLYGYDIDLIENILTLNKFSDIYEVINSTVEHNNKLGILRYLWTYLGKEYWKFGRHYYTIKENPFYLQFNVLDDGSITLHYVPELIILDINRGMDYYYKVNNKLFYIFFNIPSNSTKNMIDNYENKKILGNAHDNIFGYVVTIVGNNNSILKKKVDLINRAYKNDKYSPMVRKANYISVDLDKYLIKARNKSVPMFDDYNKVIEEMIKEKLNENLIRYLEGESILDDNI